MSSRYRILIIEDEENIREFVTALLETNGYQVIGASGCEEAKLLFSSHHPDLAVLDLGLPDADGMTFLGWLRESENTPVIVLSARSDEQDKVEALDMGANDYVTKPFGSAEFVARVRSALRSVRCGNEGTGFSGEKFCAQGLVIDYDARQVFIDQTEIRLTQTEFNIVALLARHSGKVLTYACIIRSVWGYDDYGSTKKLQVNMANIRKKFGARPGKQNYIFNELGVGYRMCEPNEI